VQRQGGGGITPKEKEEDPNKEKKGKQVNLLDKNRKGWKIDRRSTLE